MPAINSQNDWPEVACFYSPATKECYRQGKQFRIWFEQYRGHWLFNDRMLLSRQLPHSGPIANCRGFHEFFTGIRYLDAGFEVLSYYRAVEHKPSYDKAKELLGGSAAIEFINPNGETAGRPPDLLVFDARTGEFRFVECKGKNERFAPAQPARFAAIEEYLNRNPPPCKHPLADPEQRWKQLLPPLRRGQWIHIARVLPSNSPKNVTLSMAARG